VIGEDVGAGDVFCSDMMVIMVRRLNLRRPRRDDVWILVQAEDVAWWVSAASRGIRMPTSASFHDNERRDRNDGCVLAVGSVLNNAGRKCVDIVFSTGTKCGLMSIVTRWRCIHSDCGLFYNPANAHCGEFWPTFAWAFTPVAHPSTFSFTNFHNNHSLQYASPKSCTGNCLKPQMLKSC